MYRVYTLSMVNLKRWKSHVESNILYKVFKEKKEEKKTTREHYSCSSLHRMNGDFCQFILDVSI